MSNQHKYNDKDYSITDAETAPLYSRWTSMNGRCRDKGHSKYHCYGGKGIGVCLEWRESFDAFRTWALQNGFHPSLSIDRRAADCDYFPENCRWIPIEDNRARARVSRGNDHYKSVLTESLVLNAHKMRGHGWSVAKIARFFDVSPKTLAGALRGTNWKHIKAIVDSGVLAEHLSNKHIEDKQ